MQTFLPYESMIDSIKCLDWRRLGKQRVEARQILNVLNPDHPKRGWINHPAVKMWRGYEECLKLYMNLCIDEWISRGYKNTMLKEKISVDDLEYPSWWGGDIHKSHRANLLRKDSEWYGQFGWTEDSTMPYYWPI